MYKYKKNNYKQAHNRIYKYKIIIEKWEQARKPELVGRPVP